MYPTDSPITEYEMMMACELSQTQSYWLKCSTEHGVIAVLLVKNYDDHITNWLELVRIWFQIQTANLWKI